MPKRNKLEDLTELMAKLRDPKHGCPWDLAQTFHSIVPHTIEEAYEVAHAIDEQEPNEIKAELGDLLFQVIFYAQLGKEKEWFDIYDIITGIVDKLTRRHPHVFGDVKIETKEQQSQLWEKIKAEEKAKEYDSVLDAVPNNLPGLSRAIKLQKQAANLGFDWQYITDIFYKLQEEVQEFEEHFETDQSKAIDELGDIMFSCVNLARFLNVDPETVMRKANQKFSQRFKYIEARVKQSGKSWQQYSLQELEDFWQQAKHNL